MRAFRFGGLRFGCRALAAGLAITCAGPALAQGSASFTTPGTSTWTAPAGVNSVTVRAWGGGGSGGTRSGNAAGGGGGGAFATSSGVAVVPGNSYTVTVGAGGAAVTVGATSGNAGGNSSFGSVTAAGGSGGNTSGVGGAGGSTGSSSGTTLFAGGAGGLGMTGGGSSKGGGGGGGSATTTAGGAAGSPGSGSVGGAGGSGQGAGGAGGGPAAAAAGTAPGGGGGGAASGATPSGAGASGRVVIEYLPGQTLSFGAQPDQTYQPGGVTFALNPVATASSGLPVSYSSSTPSVCTVGSATTPTITITGAGSCTITASQAGNASWDAATPVARNITINKATQLITFNAQSPASQFLSGTSFAINPLATTNAAGLAITYSSLTSSVCTVSGSTVTAVAVGTCTLAANQATGNANYTPAAQATQNVSIAAGFVITAATVNGASSATLAQGQALSIGASISITAGVAMKGLRWVVAQSAPAAPSGYACENSTDTAAANGSYSVAFDGWAPTAAGTYNLYLIAYSDDSCSGGSGSQFSPVFVLTNAVSVIDVPPLAQYRADECFWTAAPGQVLDSSGNGHHGTLVGALSNSESGLVQRALSVPSNSTGAAQQAMDTGLSINAIGAAGTVAFWYRSNAAWVGGGDRLLFDASRLDDGSSTAGKHFALVLKNSGALSFGFEDAADAAYTLSTGANAFAAGQWVHIAVSWSYPAEQVEIIVNGTQAAVFSNALGALPALDTLYIGDSRSTSFTAGGSPNSANGSFDEVLIFAATQTASQLNTIRNHQLAGRGWNGAATAAAACIDHYELSLPAGSLSCLPTSATVTACADASSPCTNPYTGASGATAVLSTSAGTLASGTLSFNASGVAGTTLTHPAAADGSTVTLTLSGESIAAGNPRRCCIDGSSCSAADSCSSLFKRAGFIIASSVGGGTATVPAQTAGTASAAFVLRAVRSSTSTQACEAALSGPASVDWAAECNNPTSCSSGNRMTLSASSSTVIAGHPNSGPSSFTAVPMVFDANGNAPFSFSYADVGQVTLHASKSAGGSLLSALAGSTNAFVVRPAGFVLSNIRQTAAPASTNPAAADANGSRFVRAGENFSATVTATTASGAAAPNYGRETLPEGVLLTAALVAPAGGVNGTLANASVAGGSFTNGLATTTTLAYSEVGIVRLTPSVADGNYLGAGPVSGSSSVNIGRFVPARLALSATSVVHRATLACSPASSFSYLGENFRLGLTLTAQNNAGTTTQNYSGAFAKFDPSSAAAWNLIGRDGSTVFSSSSGRLSLGSASGSWANGVAGGVTLTANAARASAPDGPFNADFGVAPSDSDGVALASFDLAGSAGGSNDHARVASVALRFGRLRLSNAIGPADRPLAVPVAAQHWAGGTFDTNTLDSCTTLAPATFSFGNLRRTLTTADTSASAGISLAAGIGTLRLAAPQGGRSGTYDVAISLGSTATDASCLQPWAPAGGDAATAGAGLAYLRGAWCGSGFDNDPAARATFGLGRGVDALVYRRENY